MPACCTFVNATPAREQKKNLPFEVMGSSSRDLMPNTTDIGLGLYIFNSKSVVLGVIFVELPDVSDWIEKSKVAADRNILPDYNNCLFEL